MSYIPEAMLSKTPERRALAKTSAKFTLSRSEGRGMLPENEVSIEIVILATGRSDLAVFEWRGECESCKKNRSEMHDAHHHGGFPVVVLCILLCKSDEGILRFFVFRFEAGKVSTRVNRKELFK